MKKKVAPSLLCFWRFRWHQIECYCDAGYTGNKEKAMMLPHTQLSLILRQIINLQKPAAIRLTSGRISFFISLLIY